jgi:hypothetical protein
MNRPLPKRPEPEDPVLVCPECGEPAVARPPSSWPAACGPRPGYCHPDGEPLCPVIGPGGYLPASPVHPDTTPIERPGSPRTGRGSHR